MQVFLVIIAIVIGHLFAYVDSRPTWDDAGVLAFAIAIVSVIFAFLFPKRPWLWALCIGIWIPVHNLIHHGNLGSLVTLVFGFAGAYVGAALAKRLARAA